MFCSMCETVSVQRCRRASRQVLEEIIRRYLGVTDIEYFVAGLRWDMHLLRIYCAPMVGLAQRPPFLFGPDAVAHTRRRMSLR
jgi:hypothetical protein